jgi:hypothetical protein
MKWLAAVLLALAALPAQALLPIQHWQTSSGARVLFVESRGLPMLDLSVQFPAGASYDRRETSGVASMTNHLLQLGADGMSEDEIARRLADVGAQLGGRFSTDYAGLAVRTLTSAKERDQALDTFTRLLSRPQFPQEVLEREKVRLIGSLKEADTRPDTIVALNFYRLVYRDHPYALRSSGEVATVEKITRGELVEFHRSRYVAQHAVVALIGDLSRAEARRSRSRSRGICRAGWGRNNRRRPCRISPPGLPRHSASRLAGAHHDRRPGNQPRRSRLFSAFRRQLRPGRWRASCHASPRRSGRNAASRTPRTAISPRCASRDRF